MTTRGEYTTVADVRASYLDATQSRDDKLILDMIRTASRDIDAVSGRTFYPRIETRSYDVPGLAPGLSWYMVSDNQRGVLRKPLVFDDDLLAVTTLTNGDSTTINSTNYLLVPYNSTPKFELQLKRSSTVTWMPNSSGDYEGVITVAGVWGCHDDYSNAWEATGGTVQNTTQISSSGTSLTIQTGTVKAGWLLKCESEYMYASAVVVGGTNDTVTVVRGVNGSTAATHANGTAVSYWVVMSQAEMICKQAAAAYYKLKQNPTGETVVLDGQTIITPVDVRKWIETQIGHTELGKVATG